MKIGFIGLGQMGEGMAASLITGGYSVTVRDLRPEPCERLRNLGATTAGSNLELGQGRDMVCVAVLGEAAVRAVCLPQPDDPGIIAGMAAGGVLVIHSTLSPEVIEDVAVHAAAKGISVVDATLTGGGEAAARAGELTLMVGAETRDFERCLPVFQKMATNVVHIGPPGSGAKAKIINNFVVISSMAALREALDVATGIGISEEVMCDIFKSGRMASSWMSQHWNDVRGMEDAHEGGNMVPSAVGSMRKMAGLAREANKNCSMHVHMEQVLQTLTNGVTRPNS